MSNVEEISKEVEEGELEVSKDILTITTVTAISILVYLFLFWLTRKYIWPMVKPYLPPWESRPPDPCLCCRWKWYADRNSNCWAVGCKDYERYMASMKLKERGVRDDR